MKSQRRLRLPSYEVTCHEQIYVISREVNSTPEAYESITRSHGTHCLVNTPVQVIDLMTAVANVCTGGTNRRPPQFVIV